MISVEAYMAGAVALFLVVGYVVHRSFALLLLHTLKAAVISSAAVMLLAVSYYVAVFASMSGQLATAIASQVVKAAIIATFDITVAIVLVTITALEVIKWLVSLSRKSTAIA